MAGLAVLGAAMGAVPAEGATLVAGSRSGLTQVGGMAVAPDGAVWVADAAKGVCRLALDGAGGGMLVEDGAWCGPEGRTGPTEAFGLAFTTTAAGTWLLAAEGSSSASGVWRMAWDPATGMLTGGQRLAALGEDRVRGLAVAPDGSAVDVSSKRSTLVRRIADPTTCVAPCAVTAVGSAAAEDAAGLARLNGAIFLAEATGVTGIATPGAGDTAARPVAGFPATPALAVTTDEARTRLYGATAEQTDTLYARGADGHVGSYDSGFAGVTALATAPDGTVLVADDPARSSGGVDLVGQGRLFAVPLHGTNLPQVRLTAAPPVTGRAGAVSFAFDGPLDALLECRMDGAPWAACGTTSGTADFDLPDGTHTFEVRAIAGEDVGPAVAWPFVVDRLAPTVTVDNTVRRVEGDTLDLRFSGSESYLTFTCRVDGGPAAPCASPRRLTGLEPGLHEVLVTATDLAGNIGPTARWTWRNVPPPPPPAEKAPDRRDADERETQSPAAPRAARVQVVSGSSATQLVPCEAVRPPAGVPRYSAAPGGGIALVTALPPAARYVKVTLRSAAGPRRGELVALATRRVGIGARTQLWIRLDATARRRLRSRRYVVAVAFGTCGSTPGKARRAVRVRPADLHRGTPTR